MSADIIVIVIFSVMGLMAHGARKYKWMEWALRTIVGFSFIVELFTIGVVYPTSTSPVSPWAVAVTWAMTILTGIVLFEPCRVGISYVLTVVNQFILGRVFIAIHKKRDAVRAFIDERIFMPTSIPHLNAFYIYVTVLGSLLASISLENFEMPHIPTPLPVPIDALFSYNFLGLIILSFCGCGIFVARRFPEVLTRLGIVKPTPAHIVIGVVAIFATMGYDAFCSLFTHNMQGGIANKLTMYNNGTFGTAGAGPAFFLALATALCAGIGEETLIRGALQPVFGTLLAGFLHGVLHGQFNHAPILIVQVAVWSTMMGILRRYTNTTTTIITHCGWNFIMTFLIAYNP